MVDGDPIGARCGDVERPAEAVIGVDPAFDPQVWALSLRLVLVVGWPQMAVEFGFGGPQNGGVAGIDRDGRFHFILRNPVFWAGSEFSGFAYK